MCFVKTTPLFQKSNSVSISQLQNSGLLLCISVACSLVSFKTSLELFGFVSLNETKCLDQLVVSVQMRNLVRLCCKEVLEQVTFLLSSCVEVKEQN